MSKNKLSVDYDFSFDLIAITASVKEYKLAWILNRELNLNFIKSENIEIVFLDDKFMSISNFSSRTEHQIFRLLKNKAENHEEKFNAFLIPEMRNFDYFLLVDDESDTFDLNAFITSIKQIPFMQFVVSVEASTLKSKENLIF
jgi:hypothetical protein